VRREAASEVAQDRFALLPAVGLGCQLGGLELSQHRRQGADAGAFLDFLVDLAVGRQRLGNVGREGGEGVEALAAAADADFVVRPALLLAAPENTGAVQAQRGGNVDHGDGLGSHG